MSNNYIHVAFAFDAATRQNASQIKRWLSEAEAYCDIILDGATLQISSEHADLSLLVESLQRAIRVMDDVPAPQGFEWSFAADKHRVGDFGGGAAVIRREPNPVSYVDTRAWLQDQLQAPNPDVSA